MASPDSPTSTSQMLGLQAFLMLSGAYLTDFKPTNKNKLGVGRLWGGSAFLTVEATQLKLPKTQGLTGFILRSVLCPNPPTAVHLPTHQKTTSVIL